MPKSDGIKKDLRALREARQKFCNETFSEEDLIEIGGLTKEEVANIAPTNKFGVTRYERFTVWEYLKYKKKIDLK